MEGRILPDFIAFLLVRVSPILEKELDQSHILSHHGVLEQLVTGGFTYMQGCLPIDVLVVDVGLALLDQSDGLMHIRMIDGMKK